MMIAMWVRVARSFSVVLVLVCPLPIVIPFAPIVEKIQPALAVLNVAPSQVMQHSAPAPVVEYVAPVPAVSFVVSALAIEYVAPALAVSCAALAVPYEASVVFSVMRRSVQLLSPRSTKGAVTPMKNQKQCGSCGTFLFIANGNLLLWSEQQLVDCDMVVSICQGGCMDDDFNSAEKNVMCTEDNYSYTAMKDICKASSWNRPGKCHGIQGRARRQRADLNVNSGTATRAHRPRGRLVLVSIVLVQCVERFMRYEAHTGRELCRTRPRCVISSLVRRCVSRGQSGI